MVAKPTPTPLFHITAIDNLRSIAGSGLLSKNQVAAQSINFANIAFQTVQGHRSLKLVPIAPSGNLHDYVPFHFAPRSPMLKTIDSGNVEGCDYRQDDIVHLAQSRQSSPQVFRSCSQTIMPSRHSQSSLATRKTSTRSTGSYFSSNSASGILQVLAQSLFKATLCSSNGNSLSRVSCARFSAACCTGPNRGTYREHGGASPGRAGKYRLES